MTDRPSELPVVCELTPADLAARRGGLLPGLVSRASASVPIEGGRSWRFESAPGLVADLAAVIEAERHCCRFLRFALTIEPGDGSVALEVTGPEGTARFLEDLLA
jgi:hypothetical protein